jgi:hypothetical protein
MRAIAFVTSHHSHRVRSGSYAPLSLEIDEKMKPKSLNTTASSTTSPWRKLAKFYGTVGLLAALVAACDTGVIRQASTNAQQDPFAQTRVEPNFQFNVQRRAGTCPQSVGLWLFSLGFEGGADHTVIPNTEAIASGPTKLVVSEKKRLEYEVPLRSEYTSCVGQASSELLTAYNFQFRNGKVYFRMDVSRDDGYREILYKGVSANRPYIHWRATE